MQRKHKQCFGHAALQAVDYIRIYHIFAEYFLHMLYLPVFLRYTIKGVAAVKEKPQMNMQCRLIEPVKWRNKTYGKSSCRRKLGR